MKDTERSRCPEPGELLAWLDGEAPPGEAGALRLHVEGCRACATVVEALREEAAEVSRLLGAADASADRVATERRRGRWRRVGRGAGRQVAAAAVLALGMAGAAAALVPGSPLRSWMGERAVGRGAGAEPAAPEEIGPPSLSVRAPAEVDLLLPALGDALEIRLTASGEPWLEVRTPPGQEPARLELSEGRLLVEPGAARRLHLTVPAPTRVRILVGADTVLARQGGDPWTDSTVRVAPGGGSP